jgi:hypothetical protein
MSYRTRSLVLIAACGLLPGSTIAFCSAQSAEMPTIRVETREVVLPLIVIKEEKDPKGLLLGPAGERVPVWIFRSEEITGLSPKSIHIFEDGAEQKIAHLSVEPLPDWLVSDNVAQHLEYSRTPRGIWRGSDKKDIGVGSYPRLHTYLLTYVPPLSTSGVCHRVEIKVDRKHATIFAPEQYCNTKDPLSDPLNGTDLGNKLARHAKSLESDGLPLNVRLTAFQNSSGAYRVDLSAGMTAHLLNRKWEENRLRTSIAVLGLVYDKSDTLVLRFSDTACLSAGCVLWYDGAVLPSKSSTSVPPIAEVQRYVENLVIPSSYETQLEVAPGDYRLELLLTDGEKFGRATASLKLEYFVKDSLAISGIALCKRYRPASLPNAKFFCALFWE